MQILSSGNAVTVLNTVELIVAVLFFHPILEKKEYMWQRILGGLLVCALISLLIPVNSDTNPYMYIANGTILFLATFILSILFARFVYNDNIWTLIFCATCAYSIQNLVACVDSIFRYTLHLYKTPVDSAVTFLIAFCSVYGLFFFGVRKILRRYAQIRIDNKRMLGVAAISLFLEIFLGIVLYYMQTAHADYRYLLITEFYHFIGCILVLALESTLLYNKTLSLELARSAQMLHEQSKQFETSKHTIDLINMKSHDLKNQIHKIAKNNESIEQKEIDQINKVIDDYDSLLHTGNEALDVILTEKTLSSKHNHIQLTCMCDIGAVDMLAKNEIYSLFGNALDNAIEATKNVRDENNRIISINIKKEQTLTLIHIQNSYETEPRIVEGKLQTLKTDSVNHGIGMRSMTHIVQIHHGFINYTTKDGIFHLSIMLPQPK